MATEIRVYRDNKALSVYLSRGLIGPWPFKALRAIEDISDPDTISIRNLSKVYPNDDPFFEIVATNWQLFIDEQDQPWGTDRTTTVNNLNALFSDTGTLAPDITSQLSIQSTEGETVNYFLVATDGVGYEWGPLPAGLTIAANNPRNLIGVPTDGVGVYNIDMTASNTFGSDMETLTLNVISAGGFVNSKSVEYHSGGYTTAPSDTNSPFYRPGEGSGASDAWTASFWILFEASPTANETIFAWGASGQQVTLSRLFSNGKMQLLFGGGIPNQIRLDTATVFTTGVWYNVIITYDGGTTGSGGTPGDYQSRFDIYVNGVLDVSTKSGDGHSGSISPGTSFFLGTTNGAAGLLGDDLLEEFALFEADVTSQVAAIYNSGTADDLNALAVKPKYWWRMGDGDTYPTLVNNGQGGAQDMTMVNMTAGDIVSEVP